MIGLGTTVEERRAALGAVKSVAMADGTFDERERKLMRAMARVACEGVDADGVEALDPAAARAALADPEVRTRVLQAQLVMALIDGAASEAELACVRSFAKAFDIDEPRVANLAHVLHGHVRYAQFDLMRRSEMAKTVFASMLHEKGFLGFVKAASAMQGWTRGDPETARRWLSLGEYPEGTLGREYFVHMTERGFALPGEREGFADGFAKHDLCHVLGDYDTDPAGECEVVAFISGFMKTDPFGYLFGILLHMHLGIEIFQGSATGVGAFDPDRVLAALERGRRVSTDLYDPAIDWWEHFGTPLEELRARWNILPRDAVA